MDFGYLNYTRHCSQELYLLHYGMKQCAPSDLCPPMIRCMYYLHFVMEGGGTFSDGQREYSIQKGDIFVIYPDDVVSYWADSLHPWRYCWVGFGGINSEQCCEKIGVSREKPVRQVDGEAFVNAVRKCFAYAKNHESALSQMRLTGYLYEALAALELRKETNHGETSHSAVIAAIQYMRYHYDQKIFSSDAAQYVNLEYSYFYRIFKRETGITPERYLINIRVEAAKKLIQKEYPFKEIPQMIGIGNVYHFSKWFKKYTGMTPSDYRKHSI